MKHAPQDGACADYAACVAQLVTEHGRARAATIPILHRIQERYHYLPCEALQELCRLSDATPAQLTSVATFYRSFRFTPSGQHRIKVCIGTACHVKGADNVFDAFRRFLKIGQDEDTDLARLFTVEKVACLGCCMLAPAVQIDDITYGYVEPAKVGGVLGDFLRSQRGGAAHEGRGEEGARLAEIRMCTCSSCLASGAQAVFNECRRLVAAQKLAARVKSVSCTGVSFQAPLLELQAPEGEVFRYARIAPRHVRSILLRHLHPTSRRYRLRNAVDALLEQIVEGAAYDPVTRYCVDVRDEVECDYLGSQQRIATELSGQLSPLDLEEYRHHGGFEALRLCLTTLSPDAVIETIVQSGLRGRGGAGFPTGRKWAMVAQAGGESKYVICNGDEGDPGAFMDRMLMESFPFRVIEGILVAARTLGATEGVLYVRHEYGLAIKRLREALRLCHGAGLLGDNIMQCGFVFDLRVYEGAGAFVCGEETAMINSIQGERGSPSLRPPYPAQAGLNGKPTLINNAETFSLVPWIIRHGSAQFAAVGTSSSKGTKTFALAGKIVRGGLIEIPMGMTLREIIEKIGGGIPDGKRLKAVQIGGPSGGCLTATALDLPIDYEALVDKGAIMGSGGLVVLDEADCMVDIARYFLKFTQDESCGKCTFCRVGTRRMLDIMERICSGQGRPGDIEALQELGEKVIRGSICGLGRTAPNPVLSTIRYFRDEYEAHLAGRCPAGVCKGLITYAINEDCIGCTKCAQVCPSGAILANPMHRHTIDSGLCIRCNGCREVCPSGAVEVH